MSRLGCLLLVLAACEGVFSKEEKENGFVQPLDFAPIFDSGNSDLTSLVSNPIAAAFLKVDKSQYPQLFDTVVSSSIDSIQSRVAPRESTFSAEYFGFKPIASQGFLPPPSAKIIAQPRQQPQSQYVPIPQQLSPLRYDIRTVHDPNYKVYKPEENEQGEEILAALKKNPSVASYFQPAVTNIDVSHPVNYRKEELDENPEVEQNYKPNHYITGSSRIRRYAGGRSKENLKKSSDEEEDDPYNYKGEYKSRPKAFDSDVYSSAYKQEKDPNKDYEDSYGYDSGYDHKEYDRIKELSEKQAAEIRQNPGNCKEVRKDGMSCMVCKDPKTGGNYESCSYVAEPKNNKYAYSKERKFDSKDEPDEPDNEHNEQPKKSAKYEEENDEERTPSKYARLSDSESEKPSSNYKKRDDDSGENYKAFYTHTSKPKPSEALRASSDEGESSDEKSDSLVKPYNYKQALPGFYSNNEPKKDVEHVLAEFKKKDRSSCKKAQKNGMTCFQCVDKNGLKHEECMYVSESAPKQSHLAYQELKEFTSKPATIDGGNVEAESQIVTTSAPPAQKSAAYVVANNNYGKKLKRKKASQASIVAAANSPVALVPVSASYKVKRSLESEAETKAEVVDDDSVAPPEEFAGADSKGAFWAETMPRYSAALGVTLPEYMLSRSEHEASFDEAVAGA